MQINYSKRNPGVLDDTEATEKYIKYTKVVKIEDLKEMYEEERKAYLEQRQEAFVNIEISDKLVKLFKGKDGNQYAGVWVPVYDEAQRKEIFYQIVVKQERIRESENKNKICLSMFRKGRNGDDYIFHAEASILNAETQQYEKIAKDMTSVEIVNCFQESRERFKEQKLSYSRFLSDELKQNAEVNQKEQADPRFRSVRRGGR